jgi:hypothetical protein
MDAASVFSRIYQEDRWSGGSGPGSRPDFCRPVAAFLEGFIRERRIRSLVDIGCGDLQWMPEVVRRTGVTYTGLDVVPALIERHRAAWPAHRFELLDATAGFAGWPEADLYWAKDVLQHWPDETIEAFLDGFFAARPGARLLVANCTGQGPGDRRLDDQWHFAPLDGDRRPLAQFSPRLVFAWVGKHVYALHQRSRSARPRTSDVPSAWPQTQGENA